MSLSYEMLRTSHGFCTASTLIVRFPIDQAQAITSDAAPQEGRLLHCESVVHVTPELDRLIRGLAGRLHSSLPRGCGIEMADLIQAGNVGLLQAVGSFDPHQGAPLAGFARFRIRGEMLDMVRRHAGRDRSPGWHFQPQGESEDWESRLPASPDLSPQNMLADKQRAEIIGQEVLRLPARHRTVVRLRYQREMTLQQIGSELRVNESRACQIHRNALKRLKRALSSRGVRSMTQL